MRLLAKEVFIPCRGGRPVFPGFVTYVSADQPVLMHRYGWVDESDTYDDFADSFSHDNGATWTEPVMRLQSHEVPGGRVRYAENACLLDANTGKLVTLCSRALYPTGGLHTDTRFEVTWDLYDAASDSWRGEQVIAHDLPGGLGISFCFPLKTRSGRLIVPAYSLLTDADGRVCHYRDWPPALETSLVICGQCQADGDIAWECGQPVAVDGARSSRGFSENAVAELADGRLVMVLRGCNGAYPERPGYKWHCFSEDEGLTWSEPQPLPCADGSEIESGSNGCALFRSARTGKLYFIGNLALDGDRANANWPRSPLVIAEVQEAPFGLRRETITVIDRRAPHEPPLTQMSNFRFYQDRQTGDVVIFLSRYGERDREVWKLADYYRYRVEVT
jgi:hypothetical protein